MKKTLLTIFLFSLFSFLLSGHIVHAFFDTSCNDDSTCPPTKPFCIPDTFVDGTPKSSKICSAIPTALGCKITTKVCGCYATGGPTLTCENGEHCCKNPTTKADTCCSDAGSTTFTDSGMPKFSNPLDTLQVPLPSGFMTHNKGITCSEKDAKGNIEKCDVWFLADYIGAWFKYAVGIGALLGVITAMIGGFLWIISAGNAQKIGEAKGWITNGIIGIVLLATSYIILYQVNPELTKLKPITISYINEDPLLTSPDSLGGGQDFSGGCVYSGHDSIIQEMASKNGLEAAEIKAIMATESRGNANAKSGAGAMGLMQMMPDTAKGEGVTNAYDPKDCLNGGSKFFKKLKTRFGSIENALMAYNWGPGNMSVYLGKISASKCPTCKCKTSGCSIPSETQKYVPIYQSYYNKFKLNLSDPGC